jgi:hypothetical protein
MYSSKQLYGLKMGEDAIIKEHANAFKILLSQMDSTRAPISERNSVVVFLSTLPKSYEGLVEFLSAHQTFSLVKVIGFLLQEEIW